MTRITHITASLALALALAGSAEAQIGALGSTSGVGPISINGSTASTTIAIGGLQLDLTITFEEVVGLTPDNLGLSARLATATELVGRLGDPEVSMAAGFPLVVIVEPPAAGGLSFSGVATIDVHTHDLEFTADCPLRLYKAPLGGTFADITESMGMGSYRARGSTGGFSELLIVADLRSAATVVADKLDRLQALVETYGEAMPVELAEALEDQVGAIRAAWNAGDVRGAITEVNTFSSAVVATAGNPLPNVWRSSRDLVNVAGDLRAAAATLRFSLNLAS
jgi:hypothetical protein